MEHFKFFPYSWHIEEDEEEITIIRIYGLSEDNENVCVSVNDFTPYIYIELPDRFPWTPAKAQLVGNKIDELSGRNKPLKKCLMKKKKLYGAHLDSKGNKKLFPYLFCSFSNQADIRMLGYKIRKPLHIVGLGVVNLRMHEQDANPILQLTSCANISTAGWVSFKGTRINEDEKVTLCDHEFNVKWKKLEKVDRDTVAKPKIMGFDIECNSTNPSAMPDPNKPGDKIFQISCIMSREGYTEEDYESYLLTLGEPDQRTVGENVFILMYETEAQLLEGFTELIRTKNPNIITGYNILGFDIPYMIERAKNNFCIFNFDKQGFHKYAHAKEKTIKWTSSAYGTQEFQFLDAEGRLYVDLLPLVKRDFKMDNYKLKTISEYFLGQTKDDLSVKGIFKCYRIGIKKNEIGEYNRKAKKAMGIVGKYCLKDSVLVVKLTEKLQTWVGLCEMAKTCNVPIFTLYTKGQQIKVYSQVYKFCMFENIVVEKDGYITKDDERYVGAHVFPPVPGIYDRVLPFDFASLYPTTIIAYNIDYSTIVEDDNVPDRYCNVMEWEDHVWCEHDPKVIRKMALTNLIDDEKIKIKAFREKRNKTLDKFRKKELMEDINKLTEKIKPYVQERGDINKSKSKFPMCAKRYYRFLKTEKGKGVLPTILQNLLDARAHTRLQIKEYKAEIKIEENEERINYLSGLINILDKRQLAYKVSANSMYGAMGVRKGQLPFMPGAMCTTYMGRINIELVAKIIPEKYGGELVYGDTDCIVATTPVLLMRDSIIEYKTVEEISDGNWTRININKEISCVKPGYQIWSDQGFTDIVNVVRCGIKKPLSRILTHVGEVTCSNEHSLLRDTLESVTPLDLNIKDRLCISELPLPKDTPETPVYDNNLTSEVIREYVIQQDIYGNLSCDLAFLWGVFFADGSCGGYLCDDGYTKHTWVINKKDNLLLERCIDILCRYETTMTFRILDTMKSSNVNKLVAKQHSKTLEDQSDLKKFVNRYRELFYDNRNNKKVPTIILNSPLSIRQSFFMGYYSGDGSTKDPDLTITNKGAIGSAGLFYLLQSIGYKVSISQDKSDGYKLTGSTPSKKFGYEPNAVKKIIPIEGEEDGYIYDIQTENHHFSAGVGQLVVHNSNYIHFPHLQTAEESWDYAEKVAEEVSALFPEPIKLEFENVIYWRFFILTKKRYMYKSCTRNGIIDEKIGKKGVLLARRDNSQFIKILYEQIITKIFNRENRDEVLYFLIEELNKLCSNYFDPKNFVVTKAIGDTGGLKPVPFINEKGQEKIKLGSYTVTPVSKNPETRLTQFEKKGVLTETEYYVSCLPAQVQLAEKMRRRGQRIDQGTRLEYVITETGGHTAKQCVKVENADYYTSHNNILNLDFMYYLKLLTNPMDQILNVAYGCQEIDSIYKFKLDFTLKQYKFRLKIRTAMINELKSLFLPRLVFEK
jgi:DNA polymerase elongation subunit (family B)